MTALNMIQAAIMFPGLILECVCCSLKNLIIFDLILFTIHFTLWARTKCTQITGTLLKKQFIAVISAVFHWVGAKTVAWGHKCIGHSTNMDIYNYLLCKHHVYRHWGVSSFWHENKDLGSYCNPALAGHQLHHPHPKLSVALAWPGRLTVSFGCPL